MIAFAGLDPIISQSGRLKNKTSPISKRGSPLLRQALFLTANVARQNDENLKRFYDTKIGEGKRRSGDRLGRSVRMSMHGTQ